MSLKSFAQNQAISEGSSARYRVTFLDPDNAPIDGSAVSSLRVTLANKAGDIINGRDDQDALGANNGSTVSAVGVWTFNLQPADAVAPSEEGSMQFRRLTIDIEGDVFRLLHVVTFYVRKVIDRD